MLRLSDELEQKTQQYWNISRFWNRGKGKQITTGDALVVCSDVMYSTNSTRPIAHAMETLREEIIIGVGVTFNEPAKLIPFRKKASAR